MGSSSFSNSRIKLNFPLYFDRAPTLPFLLEASLFSSPIEHIRSLFDQGNATSKALPSSVWINDSLLSNTPRSSWQVSLRRLMVRRDWEITASDNLATSANTQGERARGHVDPQWRKCSLEWIVRSWTAKGTKRKSTEGRSNETQKGRVARVLHPKIKGGKMITEKEGKEEP